MRVRLLRPHYLVDRSYEAGAEIDIDPKLWSSAMVKIEEAPKPVAEPVEKSKPKSGRPMDRTVSD